MQNINDIMNQTLRQILRKQNIFNLSFITSFKLKDGLGKWKVQFLENKISDCKCFCHNELIITSKFHTLIKMIYL